MLNFFSPAVTFPHINRLAGVMSTHRDFQQRVLPVRHKLYRFALRILGSVEEAEDVVQEVLIKIWDRRQDMNQYLNMEAWCMKMTKNLSLDRLKAARRQTQQLSDKVLTFPAPSSESPYMQVAQEDTLEHIHQWIAQLPQKQQMVIQLREIEGYSYQEIAEVLDMSMEQVKVNLFRARKKLREQLEKAEAYGV